MPQTEDEEEEAKSEYLHTRIDPKLHAQAKKYAKDNGVSLGAIIRAFLRRLTDPRDPKPPPPNTAREEKRPSRKKKTKAEEKK